MPLCCNGSSQGAVCPAAGMEQPQQGKRELLPIRVAVKVLLCLRIGSSHLQGWVVWVRILAKNCVPDCALLFPLLHVGMHRPSGVRALTNQGHAALAGCGC